MVSVVNGGVRAARGLVCGLWQLSGLRARGGGCNIALLVSVSVKQQRQAMTANKCCTGGLDPQHVKRKLQLGA